MPHYPSEDLVNTDRALSDPIETTAAIEDDLDEFDIIPPSSHLNERPGKSSAGKANRVGKWKAKVRPRVNESTYRECHLLALPQDVLKTVLSRIPPIDLQALSLTCQMLRGELQNEGIWRESYINRFFWDGAGRSERAKGEVQVLVRPCGEGALGWKREALAREGILSLWATSKAAAVSHHPPIGLIHSLSLSYPPYVAPRPRGLVVGKTHQTPTKASPSTSQSLSATRAAESRLEDELSSSSILVKMTHRQKYEALLAATTRPAPYILSAGLGVGGVVRSDPLSGKVSKGFWGPGRDANFHLRPHLDHREPPTAIHLPIRSQGFVLWGTLTGQTVRTSIHSKHHSAPGSRALSVNVECEAAERHDGEVLDVWAPANATDFWVSGGVDGKVKLWQLHPALPSSDKRSPPTESKGRIECVFTSTVASGPFLNRSDAVKRRQHGSPDGMVLVRCDADRRVVCGVTADGDMRIWSRCGTPMSEETKIDVGGEEENGPVKRMELDVKENDHELIVSILIHHQRAPNFVRHDASFLANSEMRHTTISYGEADAVRITALRTFLEPTPAISIRPRPLPALSGDIGASHDSPAAHQTQFHAQTQANFGRCIICGDRQGVVSIYSWDQPPRQDTAAPIRRFVASPGKITALDSSSGLLAVGTHDARILVYDPLPNPPVLLRAFRATHLSTPDAHLALSDEFDALFYTVNQIVLESDVLVASVGRKVFAWRAGHGRSKGGVKDERRMGGKAESKGSSKINMRSVHDEAVESHVAIRKDNAAKRVPSRAERAEMDAMDGLGMGEAEALQYALMISMDPREETFSPNADRQMSTDPSAIPSRVDEVDEAVREVEAFRRREEDDLGEILDMIRRSEER